MYGLPAEDAVQATPYAVTVTADDGNGGTTSQTFSWIVNDAALAVQARAITAAEGTDTGGMMIATFTDADPN